MSEATFVQTLKSNFSHVLIYEDAALQEKGRACIPLDDLRRRAEESLQSANVATPGFALSTTYHANCVV